VVWAHGAAAITGVLAASAHDIGALAVLAVPSIFVDWVSARRLFLCGFVVRGAAFEAFVLDALFMRRRLKVSLFSAISAGERPESH
jgi:hypothetical protein